MTSTPPQYYARTNLAWTLRAGQYQDTIQQELDWQLRDRGRPVQAGEVFATSAGGPHSELAKVNKARVILHVAAVQAVDSESKVIPYKQPHQIETCVRSALAMLWDLNALAGVFSPPGTEQRGEQERLASAGQGALTSIIFPLFGTGQGGVSAADVVSPMLDGMTGFLVDADNQTLGGMPTDVYISAFAQDDLDAVEAALRERLA